jgi:BMFP domain-containing protein YqiC
MFGHQHLGVPHILDVKHGIWYWWDGVAFQDVCGEDEPPLGFLLDGVAEADWDEAQSEIAELRAKVLDLEGKLQHVISRVEIGVDTIEEKLTAIDDTERPTYDIDELARALTRRMEELVESWKHEIEKEIRDELDEQDTPEFDIDSEIAEIREETYALKNIGDDR